MNLRKLMYVVIAIVCIFSIVVGVVEEFRKSNTSSQVNTQLNTTTIMTAYSGKTQEELKEDFNNMFDNQMHLNNYDTSTINKQDTSKDIVYTYYTLSEKKDNYEVNINIPVVNISGDLANKFNNITNEEFGTIAQNVISNNSQADNNIYSITYTGYINGDIMSVIIKSSLKSTSNPQRIMVETYNYNLKTNQEATINDIVEQRGVSSDDVTKKINTQVQEAIKEANEIQVSGYAVYDRNINNDIYELQNTENYFLGEDGALYIVYAYGNKEDTSEMDIIVI